MFTRKISLYDENSWEEESITCHQNLNDYGCNAGRGNHYKLFWDDLPPFSYVLHTLVIT